MDPDRRSLIPDDDRLERTDKIKLRPEMQIVPKKPKPSPEMEGLEGFAATGELRLTSDAGNDPIFGTPASGPDSTLRMRAGDTPRPKPKAPARPAAADLAHRKPPAVVLVEPDAGIR